MKNPRNTGILLLLMALVAMSFISCSSAPTGEQSLNGGGDEFPNAMSLGKTVAMQADSSATWSDANAIPAPYPGFASNSSVTIGSLPSLGKMSALLAVHDTTRIIIDTVKGVKTRIQIRQTTDTARIVDTLMTRYSKATPNIDGPMIYQGGMIADLRTGSIAIYQYADFDGDGILADPLSAKNQVRVYLAHRNADSSITHALLVVDAGADRNFATNADNKIVQGWYLVEKGEDTLVSVRLQPPADRPYIIDNARADSQLVDLVMIAKHEPGRPNLLRSSASARYVVFVSDSLKNYAVRTSIEQVFTDGKSVSIAIGTIHGDTTFHPGDTVKGVVVVKYPATDSLTADSLAYIVKLGALPTRSDDDSVMGMVSHRFLRSRNERDVRFSLDSSRPIGQGQRFTSGNFSYRVNYVSRRWFDLTGTITDTAISALYSNSVGVSAQLEWKRNGDAVSR